MDTIITTQTRLTIKRLHPLFVAEVTGIDLSAPAPAGRLLAEDFERAMLMGGRSTKTQDWSSRRG